MVHGQLPALYGAYRDADAHTSVWRQLANDAGAREIQAGQSVEGRPLWRFDLGPADGVPILLTGLLHGNEVIGSVALLHMLDRLRNGIDPVVGRLRERVRLTFMPILNPDALARNTARLARWLPAWRRSNARGVDLNRNFPAVSTPMRFQALRPLAGSRHRVLPYYRGPSELSEPESRAVAEVAMSLRPVLSLGFHSFGNLLLFPWAHSRTRNARAGAYRQLADAFNRAAHVNPYRLQQAADFYPTMGDLDDWLDEKLGTLAMTVEVGQLDRRLLHPARFLNPFCWMNPSAIGPTVSNAAVGALALLDQMLKLTDGNATPVPSVPEQQPSPAWLALSAR